MVLAYFVLNAGEFKEPSFLRRCVTVFHELIRRLRLANSYVLEFGVWKN